MPQNDHLQHWVPHVAQTWPNKVERNACGVRHTLLDFSKHIFSTTF